ASELRAPDLVILPGSKATLLDLRWLHERGLAQRVRWLAEHNTPVLGICGGMQMLGVAVSDPLGAESSIAEAEGLSLVRLRTGLEGEKTLRRVQGHAIASTGFWACLAGVPFDGYEIHLGSTVAVASESLGSTVEVAGEGRGFVREVAGESLGSTT